MLRTPREQAQRRRPAHPPIRAEGALTATVDHGRHDDRKAASLALETASTRAIWTGDHLAVLAAHGATGVGVDLAPGRIERARAPLGRLLAEAAQTLTIPTPLAQPIPRVL